MLISRKIDLQKYRHNVYLESEYLLLSKIVDDVAVLVLVLSTASGTIQYSLPEITRDASGAYYNINIKVK